MLEKLMKHIRGGARRKPQGVEGVQKLGHRNYVGGSWEMMGEKQFNFMKQQGLQPHHVFLDVACGAFRGGVHFIRYLDCDNYLGIEKEKALIEAGIEREVGKEFYHGRIPEVVLSSEFEFSKFSKKPDYALAQSLFSHLNAHDIQLCMKRLREFVGTSCRFYATFNEVKLIRRMLIPNPRESHPHSFFGYTRRDMIGFGTEHGWKPRYIGDWGHPRKQKMMEYVAA